MPRLLDNANLVREAPCENVLLNERSPLNCKQLLVAHHLKELKLLNLARSKGTWSGEVRVARVLAYSGMVVSLCTDPSRSVQKMVNNYKGKPGLQGALQV